jgi:hypothetical protein
MAWETGIL